MMHEIDACSKSSRGLAFRPYNNQRHINDQLIIVGRYAGGTYQLVHADTGKACGILPPAEYGKVSGLMDWEPYE